MNQRRIQIHLQDKYNDWLSSLPNDLRSRVGNNAFIAGGCIVSLLTGAKVNDYDIYFTDINVAYDIAEYYANKFSLSSQDRSLLNKMQIERLDKRVRIMIKSAGIIQEQETNTQYQYFEQIQSDQYDTVDQYVDEVFNKVEDARDQFVDMDYEDRYRPIFLSDNAVSLSDKIQLIMRFIGNPRDVLRNFDFIHCTNYWTPEHGLYLNRKALTSILTKELRYVGSRYPICSLFRLRKFLARDWTITAGQILKIAMQISDLDLDDVDVLEDQLIGVDVAYFIEIIDAIKEKNDKRVDRAYLLQIIDRLM